MKIGIITIHYSFITCNYGSLMQLYAMQQVLAGMSVQSALVKQLPRPLPVPPPPTARQKLNYYCRHPWSFLSRCARSLKPERRVPRKTPSFESFIEQEIHALSPISFPENSTRKNWILTHTWRAATRYGHPANRKNSWISPLPASA